MHVHIPENLGQGGQCPCNLCDAFKNMKQPEPTNALLPAQPAYTDPYETADEEVMVEEEQNTAGLGAAGRRFGGARMGGGKRKFNIIDGQGRVVAVIRGKVISTADGYKAVVFDANTVASLQGMGIAMKSDGQTFNIPDPYRAVPAETFENDDPFAENVGPMADRQSLRSMAAGSAKPPKNFEVPNPFGDDDIADDEDPFEDSVGPMADEQTIYDEMEAEEGPPSSFDVPDPYSRVPKDTFQKTNSFEDEIGPMADRESKKAQEDGQAIRPRDLTSVFGTDDLEIF